MNVDGAILMSFLLEAAIRCRSCNPSQLENRGEYAPDDSLRCASCGTVLTGRPSFFQRVRNPNPPFLDPDRQKAIRAEIECEFP